ncbi:MAG: SPFH domain-containing protein [Epsilonproteobacteria bacterium]|nr:SPFH domain-containing protein [Campylobacterota bacterium]
MSLLDPLKRQLRSVIEWDEDKENRLFHRWSQNGDEIKNASKLIVGPAEGCIFVYEGKIAAIFDKEGVFDIKTSNIPFITTLKKFMQFFESEHKTEFYFYKKSVITDQKWGTVSTIKYLDPFYDFPIELMAFGNYSFRIRDAERFFVNFVGEREFYLVDEFRMTLNSRLIQPMSDFFAESKFSYIDIDSKREEIAKRLREKLNGEFLRFGFELEDFRIEGTDFDEATKERIGKIADTQAEIYAAKRAGVSFEKLKRLQAMQDAANNEAGAAGVFMGANVGNSLSSSFGSDNGEKRDDVVSRLKKLKELYELNLIEREEFLAKKAEILKEI